MTQAEIKWNEFRSLLREEDKIFLKQAMAYLQGLLDKEEQEKDWFDELTAQQQTDLKGNIKSLRNGTAELVSNEEVRGKVNQLFEQKRK